MKKKFKVRVKKGWYYNGYTAWHVQYANYYIIPIYTTLTYFFEYGITTYFPKLPIFSKKTAISFAEKLKCMDDVNKYNDAELIKYKKYKQQKKDLYKKHTEAKNIINI